MSDLNNPLFDSQREFLERQKEEYKNALMGDVEQIKSQGQEIGKKVAMAGGVILAGYLLKRMFTGSKKKARTVAKAKKGKQAATGTIPVSHPIPDYDPITHTTVTDFNAEQIVAPAYGKKETKRQQKKQRNGPGLVQKLIKSEYARTLAMEGVALLVAYVAKKAAERMQSQPENNDIAEKAVPATQADPVVQSASEKHAI
ncbi:hypothetical protein H8S95_10600 [Pontibacter sp. KCTC 32443]|uniref:hypothetical protein n=1 Tax=Pontibacter TaxID=323449 RepID=UPI00164E0203|nr:MULTISPECIES: hypothetical protein [Pontibacter]MBC5774510.1 hypothetical protein [Pontibacter sp. KCTC 32443]